MAVLLAKAATSERRPFCCSILGLVFFASQRHCSSQYRTRPLHRPSHSRSVAPLLGFVQPLLSRNLLLPSHPAPGPRPLAPRCLAPPSFFLASTSTLSHALSYRFSPSLLLKRFKVQGSRSQVAYPVAPCRTLSHPPYPARPSPQTTGDDRDLLFSLSALQEGAVKSFTLALHSLEQDQRSCSRSHSSLDLCCHQSH